MARGCYHSIFSVLLHNCTRPKSGKLSSQYSLGQWVSAHMHHIKGGMSELPKAFGSELQENIIFNFTVTKIKFKSPRDEVHKEVVVEGFKRNGGYFQPCKVMGNVVIITTPINILRQMQFEHVGGSTPPLPNRFYSAIEDISYGLSTKIMIQCKTRFWEKYGIQGGFTTTDLPIGQIHYPSNPGFNTIPEAIEEGILMCFTWKQEALMFGAVEPELAKYEAVTQIAKIHPEIEDQFEHSAMHIQAWHNEPSAQGADALLKPNQYERVKWLVYPWRNIYFAGEAISFTHGWIQGALESGLRAAYQFYTRNEISAANSPF